MNRTLPTLAICLALVTTLPHAFAATEPDALVGPNAPRDLVAAAGPGAGAITLTWGPAESLTGVTSYNVYRLNETDELVPVGATNATTLTFTDEGLGNGATASYVVTAVDALAEGPASNIATATTFTAPGAPQHLGAAPGAVGTLGEVALSWDAPADDGGLALDAYHVYRDGALVATLDAGQTQWTDAGAEVGYAHHYFVTASNAAGEGAASDGACSMPSPWIGGAGMDCFALG